MQDTAFAAGADKAESHPARTGLSTTTHSTTIHAQEGDLRRGGDAALPILPHILAAIFGVFAIAIVILWLSIGVWSRPNPDHLAPAGAQQEAPAQSSP